MGILRQREGTLGRDDSKCQGPSPAAARVRFLGQVDLDTWTHGHSRESQPCPSTPGVPALLAFQDNQPYSTSRCSAGGRREDQPTSIPPSPTSCDGEVSLELGPASPVPAASGSRVSSVAAFSRALTAWACVVCYPSSHPLLIPFHHHVNARGWRQGVKLCVSLSGASSC